MFVSHLASPYVREGFFWGGALCDVEMDTRMTGAGDETHNLGDGAFRSTCHLVLFISRHRKSVE